MKSKVFFVVGLVTVFFISTPAPGQQEEITLSTYYPAPFGEYDELCAEKLLVDTPAAAELQDMARGDCHITNSLIVGAAGGGFSYDEIGGSLIDGTVLIKGDVGIGTTSPGFFKLKVNGPLRVDNAGESLFSYNTGGDVYLAIGPSYTDDSSNYMYLNAYDAGGASQGFRNIVLNQFGGNVGIGTIAPYRKLEVYGAGDTRIRASSNNAGNEWVGFELGGPGNSFEGGLFHKQNDNNRVSIWSQDTEAVSILNNGNVGIGTTSPEAKLDVAGDVKIASWAEQSLTTNGYARIGSLLIQWGKRGSSFSGQGTFTVNFPTAFTEVFQVQVSVQNTPYDNTQDTWAQVVSWTNSSATIGIQGSGGTLQCEDIYWLAIGR